MPQKRSKADRVIAWVLVALLVSSIVFVAAAPFITKNDTTSEQDAAQQALEELQNQQAQAEDTPKEVDPNLKQEGDITNMQIIDLVTGTGQEAKLGDNIKVKYKGALASDGTVFDSNSDGVSFQLAEGSLIEGWTEGVPGMKVGGKRKLVIPSEKGYGAQGSGADIPPNADLVFEIELVSIGE
jgi:FKBP-type peptidyl-prolyl cis-trans isomerase FkpA